MRVQNIKIFKVKIINTLTKLESTQRIQFLGEVAVNSTLSFNMLNRLQNLNFRFLKLLSNCEHIDKASNNLKVNLL